MDPRQYYNTIPLRLMVAFGMLFHGIPKFTPEGHQGIVALIGGIGLPAPEALGWLVGIIEVGGAIALLFGALTRTAALALLAVQAVALFAVHLPSGFNAINIRGMSPEGPIFGLPGFELNLLYIALLLALLIGGPGAWSIAQRRRVPEPGLAERYPERHRRAA